MIIDLTPCYYCGEAATTVDHVIPRVIRETLADDPEALRCLLRGRIDKVWACRECNCLAGASTQYTIEERKRFVKEKLRKRYRRFLGIPNWDEDEISQLGRALRGQVRRGLRIKELTLRRLRW